MRIFFILLALAFTTSCVRQDPAKKEEIRVETLSDTVEGSSQASNGISLTQLPVTPNTVILTGLPEHRLITLYRSVLNSRHERTVDLGGGECMDETHFMPGLDLMYGYSLVNLGHISMSGGKTTRLFPGAALIRTLYIPSTEPDTVAGKPVTRDFFLVSVYDEDTNHDTILSRKDLRRFYLFNADCSQRTAIVPKDYSVVRSQYDTMNDVMFLFARHDVNRNGLIEGGDPMHLFVFDLKSPGAAKLVY